MQNVVHNSKCDSLRESDLNEVGRDHSGSSSPLSGNISAERRPSLGTNFMAELSESDDDDVSEVCLFLLSSYMLITRSWIAHYVPKYCCRLNLFIIPSLLLCIFISIVLETFRECLFLADFILLLLGEIC